MPQDWELVRVKDISPVKRGASPRPIDDEAYFDDAGEYAWVRISDVTASAGFLDTTTQRLSKLGEARSVKRQPGDLFLSIAGTVGKACITNIKACIHDGFVYFPRMNDKITKSYFFYLFNLGLAYDGLGKLGTQLNLNTETVGNIFVPLPPRTEQAAITGYLLRQTARIDKRRELLAKKRELLRDLRGNLIGETLALGLRKQPTAKTGLADLPTLPMGWQASHVKRLLRFITSGSRGWAEYYADEGDIFLRIGNLTRETIDLDLSDVKCVALPANAAEGKRTRLRPGDLLVSITADLGSIAVVPALVKPAYISQHIALCRPKEGVHPRWLGYAMVSPQAKRQLMNSGYGGTKIQLSLDDVRNVWLAVPPLDEQTEIADFLDQRISKIARQITLIDQLDDLLKQQRKALIHEAVTGKIDLSHHQPLAA
jgi:type I restriction enzyme S subunit